ncbi:MAG: hypothetical protein IBX63_08315 [Coriobacteriia bacterium]|nr:hypothetical protein [Coriobacteriia bacterium]
MIAQVDDSLALAQQWLEQIHHLADRAEEADGSALVAQATVLLGEARAKLQSSTDIIGNGPGNQASVERV